MAMVGRKNSFFTGRDLWHNQAQGGAEEKKSLEKQRQKTNYGKECIRSEKRGAQKECSVHYGKSNNNNPSLKQHN